MRHNLTFFHHSLHKHEIDETGSIYINDIKQEFKSIFEYAKKKINIEKLIAKAFNEGKEGSPIYKTEGKYVTVWLKFTYFNNDLGFPYSPNFIELVREGKETNLVIDLKYEFNIDTTERQLAVMFDPTVEEETLDRQIMYNNIFE